MLCHEMVAIVSKHQTMKSRSPLHDPIDSQLVVRMISNMRQRDEGVLPAASLEKDFRSLEDEIVYAEERLLVIKERCSFSGKNTSQRFSTQALGELLQETEQELYRLYNARQFLRAEKLIAEGVPREQVVSLLEMGDDRR